MIIQKPSERRKILDEAAGISGITARKTESKNKLEATKKNLERLGDILLDNKERLYKLKKQADKAIKFKQANEKISHLTKNISLAKLERAIEKRKSLNKFLEESSKKYLERINQLEKIEIEKKEYENNLEELKEKHRIFIQDNQNHINAIEQTNLQIANNIKQLEALRNLKIQIKKNETFQKEILDNSLSRLNSLETRYFLQKQSI